MPPSMRPLPPEHERAVAAPEAEGMTRGEPDRTLLVLEPHLRTAGRIHRARVERPGREPCLERNLRDGGLDDARGAERMAGPALRRACEGAGRKELGHEPALDLVVLLRRGAVEVDVVDITSVDSRARQRSLDREPRAASLGVGRGHMVGIARLAAAEEPRP